MKALFISAIHRMGTSYKSDKVNGKTFDFTQLAYAVPFEESNGANYKSHGFGYDVKTFDLDPKAMSQFEGLVLGQEIDLILAPKTGQEARNWVVGCKA